jgi:hypothetical protein
MKTDFMYQFNNVQDTIAVNFRYQLLMSFGGFHHAIT